MARFFTALHLASALHLQSDKCKQRRILQLLLVVFCTHLQGYILVNDCARCRGDENLTPSKTKLSPALGLIFQGSQDVSAFLGVCVWAPVCVCVLGGGCTAQGGSAGVWKCSLHQPSLRARARWKGSRETWEVRCRCYWFGTSSTLSAPRVTLNALPRHTQVKPFCHPVSPCGNASPSSCVISAAGGALLGSSWSR